jgi:hypothetical protein
MFCRFCGAHLQSDSVFCAKCGKRLGSQGNPRAEELSRTLYLKTPYPYFVLLFALFVLWAVWPRGSSADYANLKWAFELDKTAESPADNVYQQALSLVVENTGPLAVTELPIELRSSIEPTKKAEIEADFLGRRLSIMQQGRPLPLTVIIAGTIAPGAKKRILLNGTIEAEPPFKVTYEVRDGSGRTPLAHYVVEKE